EFDFYMGYNLKETLEVDAEDPVFLHIRLKREAFSSLDLDFLKIIKNRPINKFLSELDFSNISKYDLDSTLYDLNNFYINSEIIQNYKKFNNILNHNDIC